MTIKGIKSALKSMPRKLDGLYQETLDRVQQQTGDAGELGMRVLSWITHAKRPLSVDELRYGLAVEYSDVAEHLEEFHEDNLLSPESLVDVCAGLVIIDSNSQVVRLVHYTTQEYLDKERMRLFKSAEIDISRACLTYLSYNIGIEVQDEEIRNEVIESHPFLDYACHHWFSHAKTVQLSEDPDPKFVKALTCFKSSNSITISVHLLRLLRDVSDIFWWLGGHDRTKETYPYELASRFGLEDLLEVLLYRRTGPYPSLDSSLVFASFYGHLNIARLLLQHGAASNATLSNEGIGILSALGGACIGGHLAMVELLIENGADIHGRNTSPIHDAAAFKNLDIIDLLLKKGVNVNARNSGGVTACHVAVAHNSMESVRRLIDAGCDLELRDHNGGTVLLACVERFYFNVEMVDLLLDRGADACAKNKEGKTSRNIIEDGSEGPYFRFSGYNPQNAEQIVEMLRQAEQKSSTTATNDPQESEPTSPPADRLPHFNLLGIPRILIPKLSRP